MKRWWIANKFGGLVLGLAAASSASAYSGETHGFITYQAYTLSGLSKTGSGSIINRLGLDRLDIPAPFSAYWLAPLPDHGTYYDNAAVAPGQYPSLLNYSRQPDPFEQCEMQNLLTAGWISANDPMVVSGAVADLPVQNWVLRGVLREDDLTSTGYFIDAGYCGHPDADPSGDITRVMNHFYDPINDTALTTGCAVFGYNGKCAKAVNWALGFTDSFAALPVIDTSRRNHFTYEDARENMWLALIGERGRLSPPYTALVREEDTQERIYRWATVFRSLGDVIHLLQDGAQPQHVRNDKHSPYTSSLEQQAFELYTNGRVLKQSASSQNAYVRGFYSGNQDPQLPPIIPGSYKEVMFTTPLRFYTTRLQGDTATTLPDGRYGMMDYTNRGFFTAGTLPGDADFLEPPQTIDTAHGYAASTEPCTFSAQLSILPGVNCLHVTHAVEDNVQSSYADQFPSGFTAPPVAQIGALASIATLFGVAPPHAGYAIGLEEMQTQANLAIPRAIAYSAGLIDYFFRGTLAVTSPPDKIVAVLNQGAQHTMNAEGYPCVGTATNDGCVIFGFNSVRVSVQNTTPKITESGSGLVSMQNLSATAAGSVTDPNFTGPYLVAVARYHRNTCYKPDMSGQPYQVYNYTPPSTGITQPSCGTGQTTRTAYQEVSVSQSFAATAAQLNGASPFEAHFDFSADPIPVNATDLFIQVVYRGPMGDANGTEPDAIALGTLDVREPAFAAFWNNTDYFWNGAWIHENATYHNEGIESFWACSGGFPLKLVFEYLGGVGTPAMIDPITSSNVPGVVRLGFIFPPPDFAGQSKTIQGTPVHFPGDALITIEQASTKGAFAQANLENIDPSTLTTPYANCSSSLPTAPQYWCFDPVQRRRGQLFGTPDVPLYLAPFGGASSASDVDSVPLPAFAGTTPLTTGTIHFDTDATLQSCPGQPAMATQAADYQSYLHYLDVLEQARDLGVSGEKDPPLTQYH